MKSRLARWALVVAFGAAACGDDTSGESTATGSSSATGSGGSTAGSGGNSSSSSGGGSGGESACPAVCNDLQLPPAVTKIANAGALPAFTGGSIADGTYAVTSVVDYGTNTPGGTTVREIYRFDGDTIQSAIASSEMDETHFCGTFTTAAEMITFHITCPITADVELEYTATPTSFAFQHGDDPNEVAYATSE